MRDDYPVQGTVLVEVLSAYRGSGGSAFFRTDFPEGGDPIDVISRYIIKLVISNFVNMYLFCIVRFDDQQLLVVRLRSAELIGLSRQQGLLNYYRYHIDQSCFLRVFGCGFFNVMYAARLVSSYEAFPQPVGE